MLKESEGYMPELVFKVAGKIGDFSKVDNAFKTLKTQAERTLTDWEISVVINYQEKQGTGELPA